MSTRLRTLPLLFLIACSGCGGGSVLEGSELQVMGFGWYRLGALLLTPATGCLAQQSATSYALDGAPLPPSAVCGAQSSDGLDDRQFTVGVRNGEESGEVVVADMFPGKKAAVQNPPGGRVAPGGEIVVAVPVPAQIASPYRAWYEYTDSDDPGYTGENFFFGGSPAAEVHVTAPAHPGHFTLRIEMQGEFPPGRIIACSGLAKCSALAAIDLGPLAIEVAPP